MIFSSFRARICCAKSPLYTRANRTAKKSFFGIRQRYTNDPTPVQSEINSLKSTLESLQTSIEDIPSSTELNAALTALQTKLTELESQIAEGTNSEDLAALQEDLNELLESNNIYSEDLTINSETLLEFAESLNDRVAIINGDVTILITADMDHARLQAVVDRMKTIVGDLKVHAANGNLAGLNFDNLTGATNITIAQAGSISFKNIKNVTTLTLGDNYESKLNGAIDFGALSSVTTIRQATVASDFAVSEISSNTISFSRMTELNLGALIYYANANLTILGDEGFELNIASLKTEDANGDDADYTLSISGAKVLDSAMLKEGSITLTDVDTVNLGAFEGTVTINEGVRDITLGALTENLDLGATDAAPNNDLEEVAITAKGKTSARATTYPTIDLSYATSLLNVSVDGTAKSIDFTGAADLGSANLKADIDTIKFDGNGDLTDLTATGKVVSFTINDCDDLETANLDFTSKSATTGSSLIVTGNNNLIALNADKVDNIKTLTIQDNSDLASLSFDALKADATGTSKATVSIGGADDSNDLNATSITKTSTGGKFNSTSGLNDLKAYLTKAAEKDGAKIMVFFDSADSYTDSSGATANTETNLVITDSNDVDKLTVVNDTQTTTGSTVRETITWVVSVNLNSFGVDHPINTSGLTFEYKGTSKTWKGGDTGITNVATLISAINADTTFDAANIDLTVARDSDKKKSVTLTLAKGGQASTTTGAGVITFGFGKTSGNTNYYTTANIEADSDSYIIADAIATTIDAIDGYTAIAIDEIIEISRTISTTGAGATISDISSLAASIPDVEIVIDAAQTSTTVQFSSTASNTAGLASNTFALNNETWDIMGLSFTVVNESTSIALDDSEYLTITGGDPESAFNITPEVLIPGTNMPSSPDSKVKTFVAAFSDISDTSTTGSSLNRLSWL